MELILAFLSTFLSALRPRQPAASGGSGPSWAWYLLIALVAAGALYLVWRLIAGRRGARHAGTEHTGEIRNADVVRTHEIRTGGDAAVDTLPEIELTVAHEPWLKLARACTRLVDEIERAAGRADAGGRAIAEHASSRLREILERSGAGPIDQELQ